MAKRRRSSAFQDLIVVARRIPWWLAMGLAVVSYAVLHHFSSGSISRASEPIDIARMAPQQFWRALAFVGQFVVPAAFGFGALINLIQTIRNRDRLDVTAADGRTAALLQMSWQEFEHLVGEHFLRLGYSVRTVGQDGPDGGVDIELRKASELFLVQCKQWRAMAVGVDVVRQLYGVMAARGATGGFVVSSGRFTRDATLFAAGRSIQLMDGGQLIDALKVHAPVATAGSETVGTADAILCPSCGASLVKRTARRGKSAGSNFWGCSTYPRCKGTMPVT